MDWHVIRKKKKRGGGEIFHEWQTGTTLLTVGVIVFAMIGICDCQAQPSPKPDAATTDLSGGGNFQSEDQLLPTDSADPIAQAGNGDGNYYPGSGYYPSGGGYEPHEGGYPTGSGYYPTDGGNYPSDGGDHHAGGGYDHDDDDDDLEDELADSLTSIAEAIVLMSKVHPNSLKHFHPSKCQDSYYPAQNNDHGYNGDGDGDRPTYAYRRERRQASGDNENKYENFHLETEYGWYQIWGHGHYATGSLGLFWHQGYGSCNISAYGNYSIMVYGNFTWSNGTGFESGVSEYFARNELDSYFILNVTDGWYNVSGTGGVDARGTGDYFIQAYGGYWVKGSGGFDNSTSWQNTDDDHDDDDDLLMVKPEYHLQGDSAGADITGNGTYNCSGYGSFFIWGYGDLELSGYGEYLLEASGSCSIQDQYGTTVEDIGGLCHSASDWGNFNLSATGGFYNVTIWDGGVNVCIAQYGYYNISLKGSIAIQGDGAEETSIAWTDKVIEFKDLPDEYWKPIEEDGTGYYYVQTTDQGAAYILGNGNIDCGNGHGNFTHSGDGMFSTSGYGQFHFEGNGSYVIQTDWFGKQESPWGEFQVYAESGYYFVNISYGHYEISTSGDKYSCYGRSTNHYSLYAQGRIDVWGSGLDTENSHKWEMDKDDDDDDDDDDDKDGRDKMESSSVRFEGSYQLSVEVGGYRIEGEGDFENTYSEGNFTYIGSSGNFSISSDAEWYYVYADEPCYYQSDDPSIQVIDSGPCQQSGSGWFYLSAAGSWYSVEVHQGRVYDARSTGYNYYNITATGMYNVSGSGAWDHSTAWDNKTKVLTKQEHRSESTKIYENFQLESYGEKGFEIHGEDGSYSCGQGEGFFAFQGDNGNLSISGHGKYMVSGSGDVTGSSSMYGWSEMFDQSYLIAGNGDYSFTVSKGAFYVAVWGTKYYCNAQVPDSDFSLYGVGEYSVTGKGAHPDRSSHWVVEEDDDGDKGPFDGHLKNVTAYHQVSENFKLDIHNGGYKIEGEGTYSGYGEGNFTFAGNYSAFKISGYGYYNVYATSPCNLTSDDTPVSYEGSSNSPCQESGFGWFEVFASGINYEVSVTYGNVNYVYAESYTYFLKGSGKFKLNGTGAYSDESTFWDHETARMMDDGRDNVKQVPEEFELEPQNMGGYEIHGNTGYFSCEKGEGMFKFAGDGTLTTYGQGKYVISGYGSYSADTTTYGYMESYDDTTWQLAGNGSYSFSTYSGYYNLTVWGHNDYCYGYGSYYFLYGLGEFDIKGTGADPQISEHWRFDDGPYPPPDGDDDDDDIDWKDSDICELSEDEQWAAYHLINNQKKTLSQLLEYFSGLAEETFEDMCSDDHDKPDEQMWACSIIKAFVNSDGRGDGDDERPPKCSVFDIMGVLMHPDSYLSLLDESVESCSSDNPDISVSDNEYCKSVMLQEDVARTFGALLKTIDEDGLSTIMFDDKLVCPSEENKNYCNYKKYLDRALNVGELTSFTNEDIGDFFEFLFDIATGNEECPDYFKELCESEWYGPFKTVVKLADGLFSLLEDFMDDDEPNEPDLYRRQAPTTVEEKSNVVMFFEKLEDLLNIVSEGGAVMQVLSSVEMLGILGDYDDARTFCAQYPYWYDYRMCTLNNVEVQNSIFGMLDTVWNRNNAKMLSSIAAMMTDYRSIRFVVDNEYEMSDDQICSMVDLNWHDSNGDPIPNTIQELCNDDHRQSVASSTSIVRTMGKSVSAMGPMFCPAFSDLEWLDPYLKDSFNESMVEVVREVLNMEMQCMSDNLDIRDLFDIDKLLDDHELKDFVCGGNGSSHNGNTGKLYGEDDDDDDDDDSLEMITRFVIIGLLVIILIVMLMILYIQFRIIRQMGKQSKSSQQEETGTSHLSANLADNHPGGHVSNIEKRLAVPPASASSTRSVSQVDANDRTRLMKQPPNLPPPPPTFNSSVINDMKGDEENKKPRTTQFNVNPANFGFYSPNAASMAPQPPTYPTQPGQVNYGFYGDGTAGAFPPTAPDFKQAPSGSNSESGISTESRTATPDSALPDVEGSERSQTAANVNMHQF
ncbi:uncharacterized protein LOC142336193 isoform X2 [Convolutriloba macropyga]|uniref:uncharacterized protein LOC142336193 isoform X2 n=1 Tax=Convolutriloba macropyga TaxID=536237 RepID=UPI003F51C81C